MRAYLVVLLMLSGCTHALTLYPRGTGGELAHGSVSTGSKTVTVDLHGETYTGHYVQGMTYGIGLGTATAYGARSYGTATTVGASNQYSFIATSGSKALRCDAMFQSGHGNGVCAHSDGTVYDLKIGD